MKKIIYIVIASLFSLTVFLAIGSSGKGAKLQSLESEIRKLEEENRDLTTTLVSNSSLTQVEEAVSSLGLVKPKAVVYLNREEPFARLP